MNKYLSIMALMAASSAYGAGSCVICPYGYTCAGGTETPVKAVVPSVAPVGSVIYMSNTNAAHYDDDFYSEMGSDEKNALDSVPDTSSDSECPPGYLYADGRTLNIKDYPALFKKIGQAYGFNSSKKYASFKLPDLRGMFIRGVGGNAGELGEAQEDGIKTHDTTSTSKELKGTATKVATGYGGITQTTGIVEQTYTGGDTYGTSDNRALYYGKIDLDVTHEHTYEGEEETRPVNYAMYACVKY